MGLPRCNIEHKVANEIAIVFETKNDLADNSKRRNRCSTLHGFVRHTVLIISWKWRHLLARKNCKTMQPRHSWNWEAKESSGLFGQPDCQTLLPQHLRKDVQICTGLPCTVERKCSELSVSTWQSLYLPGHKAPYRRWSLLAMQTELYKRIDKLSVYDMKKNDTANKYGYNSHLNLVVRFPRRGSKSSNVSSCKTIFRRQLSSIVAHGSADICTLCSCWAFHLRHPQERDALELQGLHWHPS